MVRRLDELDSRILHLVARGEARSRASLARATGAVRSTLGLRVGRLLQGGYLAEEEQGEASGARGRPSLRLRLGPALGAGLILEFGLEEIVAGLCDASGQVLGSVRRESAGLESPEAALTTAVALARALPRRCGVPADAVRRAVVCVPAPVDAEGRLAPYRAILPAWGGWSLRDRLETELGIPVQVENDTNVMVLGAVEKSGRDAWPVMYLHLSVGVGAALLTEHGSIYRGADGAAGDVGHMRFAGTSQKQCKCGRTGCIGASIGLETILRRLGVLPGDSGVQEALRRARHPAVLTDPAAVGVLRAAGDEAGILATALIETFNPRTLIVGGDLVTLSEHVLAAIRTRVYQDALPIATYWLSIHPDVEGEDLTLLGGASLLRQRALAPTPGSLR